MTVLSGLARENRAALVHVALAEADAAASVLVLTARSSSARAWRSELLRRSPHLSGFVRVVTPLGFALAVLRGDREDLTLLTPAQRRSLVTELLTSEASSTSTASLWPTQRAFLHGPAFVDEVLRELALRVDGSTADRSSRHATPGRGGELHAFIGRYEAVLSERSLVDAPRALRTASDRIRVDDPFMEGLDPTRRLVVEQANAFSPGAAPLVDVIVERSRRRGTHLTLSTDAAPLPATTDHDARCSMLRVHHPAVEADAAISVIRHWLDAGRDPEGLAVILPQPDPVLLSELAGASARSHVPLVVPGQRIGDHRIVDDCVHALSCADDVGTQIDLVGRAYSWWESNAARLIGDGEAVEVVSTFIRALMEGESIDAALARPAPPRATSGVTVASLDDALARPSDQPWLGVVIVGCLDGRFPRRRVRRPWFRDSAPTDDARTDEPMAEDGLVDRDRRRLADLLATVSVDGSVVAIAAPVGGVLPSPFIDGWPHRELSLLRVPTTPPPRPASDTTCDVPLFPSGSLRLSATQLTTFEDCSLRYGFEYGLGLRGAGGAAATAGSLVHEVLENFLGTATDRSRERLFSLLDELWKDHEFPYAAQALDYRRRAEQWLGNWWEFLRATSPDVRLTEHRFEVPFPAPAPDAESGGDEPPRHILVGSIDRVDVIAPRGAGEPPRLRIVDYKSGSPKSQAEVDNDLQLAVYHYAATHDPTVGELGVPDRLELHYLQDDASKERVKVLSRVVSDDLERETVTRINALAAEVLGEDYSPDPDANCDYCAFHTLCPTKPQGRQVR